MCVPNRQFWSEITSEELVDNQPAAMILKHGTDHAQRAVEASRLGFWDWNIRTGDLWLSARCGEILGVAPAEVPSKLGDLLRLITPGDPEFAQRELTRHLLEGGEYDQVHYVPGIDRWLRFQGRAAAFEDGTPSFASGSVLDVTETKLRVEATAAIVDSLRQRVAVVDEAGRIQQVNRAWSEAAFESGAKPENLGVGSNYIEVCRRAAEAGCADAETMLKGLRWVLGRVRDHFEMEYECTGPKGPRRYFSVRVTPFRGDIEGVVVAHDEITDRKRLEKSLRAQQLTDPLTGLPNRQAFLEELARRHQDGSSRPFCLLLADIDDLRIVNDTWGYRVGDQLLVRVASVLSDAPGVAFLARVGGDEFALVLEGAGAEDLERNAVETANTIRNRFQRALPVMGLPDGKLRVRLSIGVALGDGSRTPDAIEIAAGLALQVSKSSGDNRLVFDTRAEVSKLVGRYARLREFGSALEHERLRLEFQPIVRADGFSPYAAETLLRWEAPDGSRFSAGDFLPAVAGTAAELEVDRWVIRNACRQWAAWRNEHKDEWPLRLLSVNVSRRSLALPDFVDWYGEVLSECGIPGSSIALEITESAWDGEADVLLENSRRIEETFGSRFWLDDIGKAYSSLEWLYDMPGSVAKIDPSYLKKFSTQTAQQRVARSMVRLVKALQGKLVAECIECLDDVEMWRKAGCDFLQGYFFAKPMRPEQLSDWLFRAYASEPQKRTEKGGSVYAVAGASEPSRNVSR